MLFYRFVNAYNIIGAVSFLDSAIKIEPKDKKAISYSFYELQKIRISIVDYKKFRSIEGLRILIKVVGINNRLVLFLKGEKLEFRILCRNKEEYIALKETALEILHNNKILTEVYEKGKRVICPKND